MRSGDQVYFRRKDGPCAGKVLCHGKHGATIDIDGKRHQVKWADILGHKERITPAVRVVDQGADGSIVEHEDGKREYIGGLDLPEPEEPKKRPGAWEELEMQKAVVLFLKAGPIKDRPGLRLEDVTDNRGRHTKRWKRSGEDNRGLDQKNKSTDSEDMPHSVGDTVEWTVDGAGKQCEVVATGKDGATVKDDSGEEHQVHWAELQSSKSSSDKQQGKDVDAENPTPLFSEHKWQDMPRDASQDLGSESELYAQAEEGLNELTDWLVPLCKGMDINHSNKKEVDLSDTGHHLFIAPLKGRKRAEEKVQSDYGGDWSKLLDIVRCTIAVDTHDEVRSVVERLKESGLELVRAPKDRFHHPLPVGYRDLMMNAKLPSGHIAEVQVQVKPMLIAKKEGHKSYEVMRSLFAKHKTKSGLEEWPVDDQKSLLDAEDLSKSIYRKAWNQVITVGKKLAKCAILFFGGKR